jgi:pimeloyl-ACP methyl ester carboxylesterase
VIGQYQACNVILPATSELFKEKPKATAWRTKPSAYIVANNDHAVHPDLERASAERMGATTYAVDNSHVPMLSQPDVVLTAIRNLAATVQRAPAMA